MRRSVVLAAVAATALAAPAAAHAAPTVYAAASLRDVFPVVDPAPRFSFAGSNTLQAQIERGAPADVFASASPREAQALYRAGRCTRPRTLATNRLVLLVPTGDPAGIGTVYGLRRSGLRLSIGASGVPVGAYTRALLARLRLSSVLTGNTVSNETNVAGVVAKVALRSADAGFVYYTDGLGSRDRTDMLGLPRWAQPPVRYQVCAVKRSGADTAGATAFISRVLATRGRALLKRYGFGLPPRAR